MRCVLWPLCLVPNAKVLYIGKCLSLWKCIATSKVVAVELHDFGAFYTKVYHCSAQALKIVTSNLL